MMDVKRLEETKLVNSLELNTRTEAEMFVSVHSKYQDNKTIDEMVEVYVEIHELLDETSESEAKAKVQIEQHINKLRKCKELLGI